MFSFYQDGCSLPTIILATIGLITVFLLFLETIWNFLQTIRAVLAPYLLPHEPDTLVKKFGPWALITGCTDGIGKAYAKELANRGLNIVLVSRSKERLISTAQEIESTYDVKTKIIAADFSTCLKAVETVKQELDNLQIGILAPCPTCHLINSSKQLLMSLGYLFASPSCCIYIACLCGIVPSTLRYIVAAKIRMLHTNVLRLRGSCVLRYTPSIQDGQDSVNNVGKQYTYPMYVGEVPQEELWDIININVGAVTMMTRLLIQGMRERGSGAIVNVSSGAECQPLPLMNVYSATKIYIKYFTEALRQEYAKDGLTIQHLSPFFLNTKMNHFSNRLQENSLFIPNAATYAKYAVSTLGKVDHSTGYWVHGIQHFFTTIPPVWIRMKIGGRLNKSFRKDYFRQHAKQEQKDN